ncbi:MAG: hypothetical protein ACKVH8_25045 [Pirellulales bacterium]
MKFQKNVLLCVTNQGWGLVTRPVLSEQVAQVYVRGGSRNTGQGADVGTTYYAFEVFALMKNGKRRELVPNLGEDAAFQLEARIEDFLDIDDEEVWKFSAPRFNLAARSLWLLAVGVLLLATAVASVGDSTAGVFVGGAGGLGFLFLGARRLYVAAFEDRTSVEEELQS